MLVCDTMHGSTSGFDKKGFIFFIKSIVILTTLFFLARFGSTYLHQQQIENDSEPIQTRPLFEPSLLSWSLATSTAEWQPRDSAASFVFQNKMWIMGGLNGNKEVDSEHNVPYWDAPHFNDIWNSDDGVTWELVRQKAAWPARRSMSVVSFRDTLWMLGGWNVITGYANDIWRSEDGVSWEKVISHAPWLAREGQTLEVFQDKLWLIGGVNYDARAVKNDVWYSSDGITWSQVKTPVPWGPRWDHDSIVFKDHLFLSGGMNLSGKTFRDVWSSPDGITWTLVTDNPPWAARQGHTLVEYKDMLWTIGRLNDSKDKGENDIWYSGDGQTWEKTIFDPPWMGREDHSVLLFKDTVFIFGGMDSSWIWRNDVWFSSIN